MSNWRKRGDITHTDLADKVASTFGSVSAATPWASSRVTSCNSIAGDQPLDSTLICPMRTGTPKSRLVRVSMSGRHWSICGRMNQ